jgi:hypothetical protein
VHDNAFHHHLAEGLRLSQGLQDDWELWLNEVGVPHFIDHPSRRVLRVDDEKKSHEFHGTGEQLQFGSCID